MRPARPTSGPAKPVPRWPAHGLPAFVRRCRCAAPWATDMRAALWLLALFGVAVAVALFAGNNQGTVTVFWPPYRVDLSLNLILLLLLAAFLFLHAALRALAALFDLPRQALRWRTQQKERGMHAYLLDALSHLLAGRFIRARKSAEGALAQEASLSAGGAAPANGAQVRALSHLLAAESAHALQDRSAREEHLKQALAQAGPRDAPESREGALMRAARWSLEDRRAADRHSLAAGTAGRRRPPHTGAAHEAQVGPAGRAHRRGARDRTPAGQAPRLLRARRGNPGARAGGRPAQQRPRSGAAAARLGRAGAGRARDARAGHPRGSAPARARWRPAARARMAAAGLGAAAWPVRTAESPAGGRPRRGAGERGCGLAGAHRSGAARRPARRRAAVPGRAWPA